MAVVVLCASVSPVVVRSVVVVCPLSVRLVVSRRRRRRRRRRPLSVRPVVGPVVAVRPLSVRPRPSRRGRPSSVCPSRCASTVDPEKEVSSGPL